MTGELFPTNPIVERRPRTDRLIIRAYLEEAGRDQKLLDDRFHAAHKTIVKWADLESSGQLQRLKETQLQGDFLAEVFGEALHYVRPTSGQPVWNLEQHWTTPSGLTPDAILGLFRSSELRSPIAVVELKGPTVNLDRDKFNGRTPVQQCWDYLADLPDCRWGIVSNMVSFRLYERDHTPRRYEHFTLQQLRHREDFQRFYALFERGGLIPSALARPRALELLNRSDNRQREVGDELYEYYSRNRLRLIQHLHYDRGHELDEAIAMAQQLLDRVIFVAFCEDRGLLPQKVLDRAWREVPAFSNVVNPRWHNYRALFRFIDKGHESIRLETGYNGGLFAHSPVDDLELDDEPWVNFFKHIGDYDFADEVNLDVLGHLFEKSITELEKLREGDFFGESAREERTGATMPQSARRKRLGVYYTPPDFTAYIVQSTVGALIAQRFRDAARRHGIDAAGVARGHTPDSLEYWRECLAILRNLKICDPSCGSGAFLFQAYELLEHEYDNVLDHLEHLGESDAAQLKNAVPDFILNENLHGVDLSPEAVEIAQLALWIRSARPGRTLSDLSRNVVVGNSLVHDPAVHPFGFDWRERFPDVFNRDEAGFDCIVGNPPWERLKLQEREFFSLSAPKIATATNAAKRRALVAALEEQNPELYERYLQAQRDAAETLDYVRNSGAYPLTGSGDINTYAAFAELASQLVAPHGRVGLLVPSGIASDKTTSRFFGSLARTKRLIAVYDFENRRKVFADVDGRFKFSIFLFGGTDAKAAEADFVFFAHRIEELAMPSRHVALSDKDIRLLNPNTRTCPIFRSRRDAEITKRIYRNVPVLIDHGRKDGGNPWGIRFIRMFDQTNDAELFHEAADLRRKKYNLDGNRWTRGRKTYLPLYEAKMVQMYDHRAASVVVEGSNWVRQGQTESTTLTQHQNPEFVVQPRFWVEQSAVERALDDELPPAFLAYKDVTSPTNQRTMIAAFIPAVGVVNSAPLVFTDFPPRLQACLLANLNSYAYDFVARQKISNIHLNFFIVEQLPTFAPDAYADPCPWERRSTLADWISERVLKLTCTSLDMLPLAEAAGFASGNHARGRIHKWRPDDRAQLLAELDAAYFILYGIDRDDAAYILSTFNHTTQPDPALPGATTIADRILDTYDYLHAHCR